MDVINWIPFSGGAAVKPYHSRSLSYTAAVHFRPGPSSWGRDPVWQGIEELTEGDSKGLEGE